MTVLKSLCIAVAMYSKFPAPRVDWDKKSLSWALCWFPVVGVLIGLFLALWLFLAEFLGLSPMLRGAGALLIPITLSGGIHLDGFCDTSDALGSHQEKARKLEILKDSRTGAFAVICCCLYLIFFFATWCEVVPEGRAIWILTLGPVLSRSLSGLAAVSWPNARGTGLLATFTQPMDAKKARVVLVLWLLLVVGLLLTLDLWLGGAAVVGALVAFLYYRVMSMRQFGGITGDLAGFFLQICEVTMVLALALAQKIEVLAWF